jgi:hypothetical protein
MTHNYDNPVRWPEDAAPGKTKLFAEKNARRRKVESPFTRNRKKKRSKYRKSFLTWAANGISSGKKVSHLQDLSQGTLYAADGVLNFGSTRAQWYNFFTAADLGIGTSVAGTFQTAAGRKQTTEERLVELELQVAMLGRDRARLQEVNAGLRSENAGLKEQLNPQKIEKVAYFPGRGTPSAKSGGPT